MNALLPSAHLASSRPGTIPSKPLSPGAGRGEGGGAALAANPEPCASHALSPTPHMMDTPPAHTQDTAGAPGSAAASE